MGFVASYYSVIDSPGLREYPVLLYLFDNMLDGDDATNEQSFVDSCLSYARMRRGEVQVG